MAASDDEDDYMNMVFEDAPKQETSIQRRLRIEREGQERGRVKSKAELAAEADAAREKGLMEALDSSNKGFKMMAKFGFKQGDTLGKSENARKEPIQVSIREDKGGIGMESEKKRKFREAVEKAEDQAKRFKVDEGDYRDRVRQEREEKKNEAELRNAQKTAERLDEQKWETEKADRPDPLTGKSVQVARPLKEANVIWRGLLKQRLEHTRTQRQRRDLQDSLTRRLPKYVDDDDDDDEDADDRLALGHDSEVTYMEEHIDDEDIELEEFDAQPVADRLRQAVLYLRGTHHYCFWCKYQYPDAEMDGCPGITEEDHD